MGRPKYPKYSQVELPPELDCLYIGMTKNCELPRSFPENILLLYVLVGFDY